MEGWIVGVGTVGLLLVAAKAHGREVRLHRELHGHWQVDFAAQNHPWVEALWRRDRIRFWTTAGLAAAALAGLQASGARSPALPSWLLWPLVVPWAMTVAFAASGLWCALRTHRALAEAPPAPTARAVVARERPAWLRDARRGSAGWWGAVAGGSVSLLWILA